MPDNIPYLLISAAPTANDHWVADSIFATYIKKIEITETSGVNLTSSNAQLVCGSSSPVTFTVNNPNGIDYISGYKWLLGADNGWLYNGSPPPADFETTSNSIALTPACGTPKQLKAVVRFTGTTFADTTNAAAITVTLPQYSNISGGSTPICSGNSSTFSMPGLASGTSVSWSATPAGQVTPLLTPSGNSVTVAHTTPNGFGGVILKALMNNGCAACDVAVSRNVWLGTPDRPKMFDEQACEVRTLKLCTDVHGGIDLNDPWSIYMDITEWEWEKVTGSFDLIPFGGYASIIGFSPSSGFVSVRAKNSCGWGILNFFVVRVVNCSNPDPFIVEEVPCENTLSVMPNPAAKGANNVTSVPSGSKVQLQWYDLKGTLQASMQQNVTGSGAIFNTKSLPEGPYMLRIQYNKISQEYPVVIYH